MLGGGGGGGGGGGAGGGGPRPVMHISLLVTDRLNKPECAIFAPLIWSLLPKDLTNQNLSSLQLVFCRLPAVNVSPYNIIFLAFLDH